VALTFHEKHKYRLVVCGHKAVEVGAVCLLLMVQGNITGITLGHLAIASQTGLLAVFPTLWLSFTRFARHLANRWTSSGIVAVTTFVSDASMHGSHYPGAYSEAALTAIGAFLFSIAISYTPIGKQIDRLAESFLEDSHAGALQHRG
jgi:hypothetical protein